MNLQVFPKARGTSCSIFCCLEEINSWCVKTSPGRELAMNYGWVWKTQTAWESDPHHIQESECVSAWPMDKLNKAGIYVLLPCIHICKSHQGYSSTTWPAINKGVHTPAGENTTQHPVCSELSSSWLSASMQSFISLFERYKKLHMLCSVVQMSNSH